MTDVAAPTYRIDLDALYAELGVEEAPRPAFVFTFGGEDYELPADVDVLALAAMEGGRLDDGLRRILGPAQYLRIQNSPQVFRRDQLKALMEAWRTYCGAGGMAPGESGASTSS